MTNETALTYQVYVAPMALRHLSRTRRSAR